MSPAFSLLERKYGENRICLSRAQRCFLRTEDLLPDKKDDLQQIICDNTFAHFAKFFKRRLKKKETKTSVSATSSKIAKCRNTRNLRRSIERMNEEEIFYDNQNLNEKVTLGE